MKDFPNDVGNNDDKKVSDAPHKSFELLHDDVERFVFNLDLDVYFLHFEQIYKEKEEADLVY